MGVQGLLPMLKSVMNHVNIEKFKGKTVGIDAAGWLYKGCYSCAADVVQGKDTDVYLNFCIQQIKLLQEVGVRPFFVFDGAPLPAKAQLNASRYRMRETWRQRALRAMKQGDESEVSSACNKAVSVSNAMVMKFIAVLRRMNIDFLVAPYEADAQLAYLSKIKIVDAVISEDSDCIPYGCRTVLFKWSADGWASELKRRSLGANEDLSFVGWTEEMFVQLCVLCGCDYCPSVPGIGVVTAYKLVNTHKKPNNVIEALKEQKMNAISDDYESSFLRAVLTFRHHLVFDPHDEKLKMLNPLSASGELVQRVDKSLSFLGNLELKDSLVASIAHGSIHPVTHESYAWRETAELQSLTWRGEGSSKSMTSSETSSNADTWMGQVLRESKNSPNAKQGTPVLDEKENGCRTRRPEEERGPSKPSVTSWRHLQGVLGTSTHILNFRSPKVSENFRSLVSSDTTTPLVGIEKSKEQLKAFEEIPCRQTVKRIRNPRNRKRDDQKSGFDGEVTCRVDMNDEASQRVAQRRRLSAEHLPNRLPEHNFDTQASSDHEGTRAQTAFNKPAPFFVSNRQFCKSTTSVTSNSHLQESADSGSEDESEEVWSLRRARQNAGGSFNAVSVRKAMSAEEKWDRILESELGESEHEDAEVCSVPESSPPEVVIPTVNSHTRTGFQ